MIRSSPRGRWSIFSGFRPVRRPWQPPLALRVGLPVFPLRVQRTGGAAFRVTIEPALPVPETGMPRRERTLILLRALNDRFGAWIRACPEQWLWIHQRWPT